ncbi:Maltokinase [Corynebacterium ciconiae DSM 44920]|uniref:phosphotransferase n=1 Tax=Corynebacterium ciconiae TaxID=227319 RepID=UPI00036611A0|nr:phosphotransferase [Corynebacterium ciconiae]WKD60653.1 Maltokinase [Corynebacterium ciconiae DSM 44920]
MDSALATMLASQRFYGAKSEAITDIEVVHTAPLSGSDDARWVVARVHRASGSDLYQLLLDGTNTDVLAQPAIAARMGELITTDSLPGGGQVHTVPGATQPLPPDGALGRVIEGEQSNTSIIFGEKVIVKFFRKLAGGINPDVELLAGLSEHHCGHIAPLRGYLTHEIEGETMITGMVQDFVPEASDGWADALAAVRQGADFSDSARNLGVATAEVHQLLARHFGAETVPGSTVARALSTRLEDVLAQVPDLEPYAEQARAVYQRLHEHEVPVQRVHGDLHLGQTLKQGEKYILIDFEGEPARPLAERRRMDSPLRDVAGLIRSIDYAANFEQAGTSESRHMWCDTATASLLDGYRFDHSTQANFDILDAFVLDKALYEVAYEANNRPDWMWLPLGAVNAIVR